MAASFWGRPASGLQPMRALLYVRYVVYFTPYCYNPLGSNGNYGS